ncbi:uncharacterized protein L969DRAFT_17902 [Mixia osmundae IAM 14324]|uniref:Uncharacterized protein n=1 Tax=Mixia osmundae (strain CBS 9802 / IAM 14324 / JCM 22182 / KY 12970) TaxID=764103 RepID=G7E133_MIXOS|nr:uncharacterized protein L969DRAFT_17902 [Mixia osmundae IAM 14324]KEI38821.1 hypothetical protein L969DRAFT_17902 [Mixia osmundae IAM 14324]GAA96543.1 hypothetical protein E5Q_03211 [Mixia osmundae IAM 14324]
MSDEAWLPYDDFVRLQPRVGPGTYEQTSIEFDSGQRIAHFRRSARLPARTRRSGPVSLPRLSFSVKRVLGFGALLFAVAWLAHNQPNLERAGRADLLTLAQSPLVREAYSSSSALAKEALSSSSRRVKTLFDTSSGLATDLYASSASRINDARERAARILPETGMKPYQDLRRNWLDALKDRMMARPKPRKLSRQELEAMLQRHLDTIMRVTDQAHEHLSVGPTLSKIASSLATFVSPLAEEEATSDLAHILDSFTGPLQKAGFAMTGAFNSVHSNATVIRSYLAATRPLFDAPADAELIEWMRESSESLREVLPQCFHRIESAAKALEPVLPQTRLLQYRVDLLKFSITSIDGRNLVGDLSHQGAKLTSEITFMLQQLSTYLAYIIYARTQVEAAGRLFPDHLQPILNETKSILKS